MVYKEYSALHWEAAQSPDEHEKREEIKEGEKNSAIRDFANYGWKSSWRDKEAKEQTWRINENQSKCTANKRQE